MFDYLGLHHYVLRTTDNVTFITATEEQSSLLNGILQFPEGWVGKSVSILDNFFFCKNAFSLNPFELAVITVGVRHNKPPQQ